MSLKDNLRKLKEQILNTKKLNNNSISSSGDCNLNNKIDKFINWSIDNKITKKEDARSELKNFIEKMAVWYELRYPDYEINRLIPYFQGEDKSVSIEMFANNSYIQRVFGLESDVAYLDWDKFYNTNSFVNSLTLNEKFLLKKPTYKACFYLDPNYITLVFLNKKGIIRCVDDLHYVTNNMVLDDKVKGVHIKEFVSVLKQYGITLKDDSEIQKVIRDYENQVYFKEELLNCVMYRIIERGGSKVGPRRGFIFAKEFKRNIDIPMMYGLDSSISHGRYFINEYLKAGGSINLECYVNYFRDIKDSDILETVTIKDKLAGLRKFNVYSKEEKELFSRFIGVIDNNIDHDFVKKEEVKRLRLERKLEISKNRK